MKFLNPAGLWLLLGIPLLILIYLIKSQHEEREVSSTYIWRMSKRFMKKRIPVQKFNKILLFALQLIAILAVSFIAARPAIVKGDACDYIAIIDGSGSMQIKDAKGQSRFESAVLQVEKLAEEISRGHSLSVIVASEKATDLIQGATSTTEAKIALEGAECTYGECNIEEAISMAQLMCEKSDNPKVLFYTDQLYKAEHIQVVNMDRQEWNVSVNSLVGVTDGQNMTFTGTVISHHKEAAVTVGLKVNGTIMDAQVFNCKADEETEVVFTVEELSSYDTAEIFVETSDGLDADNVYAICNKREKTYNVCIVSTSPLYFKNALQALGNYNVKVTASTKSEDLKEHDLYIFDGIIPEEYPTDGSILMVGAKNLPDGLAAGDVIKKTEQLRNGNVKDKHFYEGLFLNEVAVTNFSPLTGNSAWETLLLCGEAPVLVNKQIDHGRNFAVMSFDLHDSNLPMQTGFLVLMRNLVEYLAPTFLKDTEFIVGDTAELAVLQTAKNLHIEYPNDEIKELSIANEYAKVVLEKVGVYTAVMTTEEGGEYVDFFVRLPESETQSDDGKTLLLEMEKDKTTESKKAISEMWFWITLVCLIIILTEWGWYCREQY